jgi:chromosome segregation ATPase
VFTPALSKFLGSTGNGSIDLAIQFAVFAVIVGLAYVLIVRPLLKLAARPPQKLEQRDSTPAGGGTDLDSLMSALQNQALELRGKHASAVSSLSLDFDVLNNRLSTIGSRLNKAMEAAAKSEASVAVLTTSNDDYRRRLSEAEGELALLRPLTAKLEHELRLARNQITETDRRLVTLETDHAAAQGTCNELLQKMSSADLARQRTMEENAALAQKLNEREFAVQSLLREAAHLKSESASITGNLELAERDARLLADKYTVELEGNSRSSSALNALQLQFAQFRKDSAAQVEQIEGRNAVLTETLTIKDKQIYDSENKRLALESKIDFLTLMNQRLREDLRRHLDHIGNLEASNRKLLDLLARDSIEGGQDFDPRDAASAARPGPKLIAPLPRDPTERSGT